MLIFLVLLYLSINNSLSASQMFPPQKHSGSDAISVGDGDLLGLEG